MAPFVFAESPTVSFAYILQADSFAKTKAIAVERLTACERDWIVLDAAFSSDTPWEPADLGTIRGGHAGRKVVAYISIGEAEKYRPYWRKEWESQSRLTIAANRKKIAEGRLERTVPVQFSLGEGLDIGLDIGSAVDFTYKLPFKFTGTIKKVEIDLGPTN